MPEAFWTSHDCFAGNVSNIDIPNTQQRGCCIYVGTGLATLTVVKIDTQELLVAWFDVDAIDGIIPIEDHSIIITNVTAIGGNWNQTNYNSTDYKISITTSKGNIFDTVAIPYDT